MNEHLLNELVKQREIQGYKGRQSSKSHLKSAAYDWRVENNWSKSNAFVLNYQDKGYAFITFTVRNPHYCVLRHIVTLEEYRGQGVGRKLMQMVYDIMKQRQVNIIRFFADIPSVKFYETLGYKWHGKSKTGLPFTYTDITTMQLLPVIKRDQKRLV